jgi:hypothetical protein
MYNVFRLNKLLKMSKDLTKTHRNAINKIRQQLILRQSMTYRQMILCKENEDIFDNVVDKLNECIKLLKSVKNDTSSNL